MRFLADENLNSRIIRGIRREDPSIDILRIQETEVFQVDDQTILEWAAEQDLIIITHDVNTMTKFAYERVRDGKAMPGIVAIHQDASIGVVIEDFVLLAQDTEPEEFKNYIFYLPL